MGSKRDLGELEYLATLAFSIGIGRLLPENLRGQVHPAQIVGFAMTPNSTCQREGTLDSTTLR